MKHIILLFFPVFFSFQLTAQQVAIQGGDERTNLLYTATTADATGRNIYIAQVNAYWGQAYVKTANIFFNQSANRWEYWYYFSFGAYNASEMAGFNTNVTTPGPPETGWTPEGYSGLIKSTTIVYTPQTKTANCEACNWSNADSWTPVGKPLTFDNIVINGSVTMDENTSAGNLTVNTGKSLTGSAEKVLTVYGNIVLNGMLTTGRLNLKAATELDGTKLTVRQLEADPTITVTLTGNLLVFDPSDPGNGQYRVTGTFGLGNYDLTTFGGLPDAGVTRSDVLAITNGTGNLQYYFKPGDTYSRGFRTTNASLTISGVGNNGSNKPYFISFRTSPEFSHTPPASAKHINCEWNISTGLIDATLEHYFNLVFQWPASAQPEDFNSENTFLKRWNGTSWENKAGPLSQTARYISVQNVTEFSPWGVFDAETVLPVKLTTFTAAPEGKSVGLKWTTTEESNSDRFAIERGSDGKNWQKIDEVLSKGESQALVNYSYTDQQPANGRNFYRLKMIDKDETFAYSRIRQVNISADSEHYLYPNPVSDLLFLNKNGGEIARIKIADLQGRTVLESAKNPERGISVKSLSSGIYVLKIFNTDGTEDSQKLIISR